jgi:putative hydrolase of the HAD superfamily
MIDWNQIDTVFLDMDGTLLDLHFDNHFWLEHVPRRYAEARGMEIEAAREELLSRYKDIEGTLKWYCIDHWSRELELDIALLKEEVDHLIAVHPHVVDFLIKMRESGKRTVLVTNAHQKSLALKLDRTQLRGRLDAVVCSHDFGLPKEDPAFWDRLYKAEPFAKERTLFVDDSPAVLASARRHGIRWLLRVLRPDSKGDVREAEGYDAIHDFSELLRDLG